MTRVVVYQCCNKHLHFADYPFMPKVPKERLCWCGAELQLIGDSDHNDIFNRCKVWKYPNGSFIAYVWTACSRCKYMFFVPYIGGCLDDSDCPECNFKVFLKEWQLEKADEKLFEKIMKR
jgi:DNA-directed RNA polymerase subunit RPC12/RpoP